MPKFKVAIIGPESTGKTTLAEQLSETFHEPMVSEYARIYIDNIEGNYKYEDLLCMAKAHEKETGKAFHRSSKVLFMDTSLLTIEIWSQDKFDKCDPWILEKIKNERIDLYLLCNNDTPWVFDPQREDEHRRNEIFDLYLQYLDKYKFLYETVSGLGQERLKNAIHLIEKHLGL